MVWTALSYHRVFFGPFVFDDTRAILANPSIRRLGDLGAVLSPPQRMTVSGRPLLNLSLALNYAWGRFDPWGYHALNLLIHLAAGVVLAALVRRTARRGGLRHFTPEAFALSVALLWMLHPLQTESVSYVVQRAESLAALFYLLTLYGVARCAGSPSRGWAAFAIAVCACGMASKETMASAPLVALAFDRAFFSGGFRAAWRRNRTLYAGLAATWILLAALIAQGAARGGSVAFANEGRYLLTQGWAIFHYLRLAVWPHPLVFDYGNGFIPLPRALPALAILLALITALALSITPVRLQARPGSVACFLAFAFFAILAPSSSVVPIITETIAEHRMYLPLAPFLVGVLLLLDRLPSWPALWRPAGLQLTAVLALAMPLSLATAQRNADYADPLRLWRSSVAAWPRNPRAQANLAQALMDARRYPEAKAACDQALKAERGDPDIWYNLGCADLMLGDASGAIPAYEASLRLAPRQVAAHLNLAVALERVGRADEALSHFREAVRLDPENPAARRDLATALARRGLIATSPDPATPP